MAFVLFIFVVVGITLAVAAASSRQRLNEAWQLVAEELGLAQTAADWTAGPRLDGSVAGFPVTIDIEKKGSGKSRTPWTRFAVGVPGMVPDLSFREEGFLSAISKAFGTGDIEVGDPEFDRRFHIAGRSADEIRAYLTPRRRTVLERFFTTHRATQLKDQTVTWAVKGKVKDSSQMVATVEDMLTLARALSGQEQVETGAVADAAPAAATPIDPAPVDEVTVEDVQFAEEALAAQEAHLAGEWETVDEAQLAAEPAAAVPDLASGLAARSAVDLREFCESVFSPGALSFQASKAFDQSYKGQQATWTGTLQAIEPYNYDFVFGSGKGVKATLDVHKVDGNPTGDGIVRAVLQLPADAQELASRIGEQIEFSGKLTKVDGLMRKVFLADGRAGQAGQSR